MGFPDVVPDLVAEVVGPSDRAVDVMAKASAWLAAGVQQVWVVDPSNQTVTVHGREGAVILHGDDVLRGEGVIPGFEIPLAQLWA